ncbi:class I SAM-dependent methyltransferase [Sagittula stellata]|uniref:class I SAM-dependent methyltransferase n=1 Tax=Sagittula stellata TaxID=52603 RepID=UPI00321ACB7C
MKESDAISGYALLSAEHSPLHAYLLSCVREELARVRKDLPQTNKRLFDLGCGNGSTAAALTRNGWIVSGVDPLTTGIAREKTTNPELDLQKSGAYDNLASQFGTFTVPINQEVFEYLYSPKAYARCIFDLLESGEPRSS